MNPNQPEPDDDRIDRMKSDDGLRDRTYNGNYLLYRADNHQAWIKAREDETIDVEANI